MMKQNKKILQFELWQECNNNCKFCYLWRENKHTPDELKLSALQKTIDKISDLTIYEEYDTLAFIGGEFFQGQLRKNSAVKEKFYELIHKAAELYNNGTVKEIWLTATMCIGRCEEMYELLKLFNNHKNIWIVTSWDTMGRFQTQKMEDNWKFHMHKLLEEFPDIQINVSTILTGDLVDKYLNNEFTFISMMKEYKCTFFFKQCGPLYDDHEVGGFNEAKRKSNIRLPNFFPTREKFLQFLMKFKQQEPDILYNKLFNVHYRADDLYRNYNVPERQMEQNHRTKDKVRESLDYAVMDCGHIILYAAYCDSDKCVLCDKEMIDQIS